MGKPEFLKVLFGLEKGPGYLKCLINESFNDILIYSAYLKTHLQIWK